MEVLVAVVSTIKGPDEGFHGGKVWLSNSDYIYTKVSFVIDVYVISFDEVSRGRIFSE